MPRFVASQVQSDQISAAFPLVRMAMPELDPGSWTRFVAGLAEHGGALLGVFAGDATLHGIAIYRIEESLKGRRFVVDALVTFELIRAAPARSALMDALEREAVDCGCAALALSMPAKSWLGGTSTKAKAWLREGFALDTIILARPLVAKSDQATSSSSGAEPR